MNFSGQSTQKQNPHRKKKPAAGPNATKGGADAGSIADMQKKIQELTWDRDNNAGQSVHLGGQQADMLNQQIAAMNDKINSRQVSTEATRLMNLYGGSINSWITPSQSRRGKPNYAQGISLNDAARSYQENEKVTAKNKLVGEQNARNRAGNEATTQNRNRRQGTGRGVTGNSRSDVSRRQGGSNGRGGDSNESSSASSNSGTLNTSNKGILLTGPGGLLKGGAKRRVKTLLGQ